MPTYGHPGTFVEENLTPLASTFQIPGVNAAAFIGAHYMGPTIPTEISSWSQFLVYFGGFGDGTSWLPFAVYEYFLNGGQRCWVTRVAGSGALGSSVTLVDSTTAPGNPALKLTALSPGAWGNSLSVDVVASGTGTGRFDLYIHNGSTNAFGIVERWVDLSMNPTDRRYAVSILNSATDGSRYVVATNMFAAAHTYSATDAPKAQVGTPLTAGTDGSASGPTDIAASVRLLDQVDESLDLCLPGETRVAVLNDVITYIDPAYGGTRNDIFLVVDTDKGLNPAGAVSAIAGLNPSSYWAAYWPWIDVQDPMTSAPNVTRRIPLSGAVLGEYAATDATKGVQNPAAGVATSLSGVLGVEYKAHGTELDMLNNGAVNVVRFIPGAGYCIMGARTGGSGFPDRYVNVRRSLIYIKRTLIDGTRYAIFEPNNSLLWENLSANITQYLTALMQVGVLKGSTPAEAFYVVCDETNNPPSSVNQGVVNVDVGVALSTPAEFIVIRLAQFEGSASATDSLTNETV